MPKPQFGTKTKNFDMRELWPEERQRKALSDLMTTGSTMAETHPYFRGIEFQAWRMLKITEQCSELAKTTAPPSKNRKWVGNKSVATPRDSYGWKSL